MCILDSYKQERIDAYRELVGKVTPIAAEPGGSIAYLTDDEIIDRYQSYCVIEIPHLPFSIEVCGDSKKPQWNFSYFLIADIKEFDIGKRYATDILPDRVRQEFPNAICVSQSKTPAAIAKDVNRRLIAGGLILWERMQTAIELQLSYFRKQADNAKRLDMLAKRAGIDLKFTETVQGMCRYISASVKMSGYPALSITDEYVRIDMKYTDLTVEQAAAILAIIAPKAD